MTVDSSLYAVTVAPGTYNKGVGIPLACIKGPAVVRDGYGSAIMKRVVTFATKIDAGVVGKISIKNSSWIDAMQNFAASANANNFAAAFAPNGPNVQRCGDVELQSNSTFTVEFVPDETVTTTQTMDFYCLIDIDYPSVAAVSNPKEEKGTPVTLSYDANVTTSVIGTPLNWSTYNVDIFKAGYRYLMVSLALGATQGGTSQVGFVAISGAAGQSGLSQIIPSFARPLGSTRLDYDYSNVFVKGPMNIDIAVIDNTNGASSAAEDVHLEIDTIRR